MCTEQGSVNLMYDEIFDEFLKVAFVLFGKQLRLLKIATHIFSRFRIRTLPAAGFDCIGVSQLLS